MVSSWLIKKFILYLFLILLVDPLTLTILLSLINTHINITSQKFSSTPFHLLFIILYSSHPYGSTSVLPCYLLLRHSCTWDKTSIFWSCQVFGAVAGEVSYCINYIFYFIFLFTFIVFLIFISFFFFRHLHESLVTHIKWQTF